MSNLTLHGSVLAAGCVIATAIVAAVIVQKLLLEQQHHDSAASIDTNTSKVQAHIAKKQKQRERDQSSALNTAPTASSTSTTSSSSSTQLPPGQTLAKSWIVLDLGSRPSTDLYDPWHKPNEWSLKLTGVTGGDRSITLQELRSLGVQTYAAVTWHCVTGWSAVGLSFEGVAITKLIELVQPLPGWQGVLQLSADGYTTNVYRSVTQQFDYSYCSSHTAMLHDINRHLCVDVILCR
jgi:DMSO/TMAO reductase YedYZ molybdopterin-dependent catalytic subunit